MRALRSLASRVRYSLVAVVDHLEPSQEALGIKQIALDPLARCHPRRRVTLRNQTPTRTETLRQRVHP